MQFVRTETCHHCVFILNLISRIEKLKHIPPNSIDGTYFLSFETDRVNETNQQIDI